MTTSPFTSEQDISRARQRPRPLVQRSMAFRVQVAILFGLAGFFINFFDIALIDHPTFKISILAGLFFPLLIALAWGWRYGLLSALAGGCQSMWWLWQSDGWGFIYAVPVFTLWIVWHGWWAGRRHEKHPWYYSMFAVEVPFRVAIELGFHTIFRWLVALNPPPWNPAISWHQVSPEWLFTISTKHAITAYILLLAAYVTLSMGPARRFFGLPPRPIQRDTNVIYAGALLIGLLMWAIDATVATLIFHPEMSFWESAVYNEGPHIIFMRSLYVVVFMITAVVIVRFLRERALLTDHLNRQNHVLAAIRRVNQLITHETDRQRLLDETCRLLIETRGYLNVWIILTENGKPVEPFFHAGFHGDFAPMVDRLTVGDIPHCVRSAMDSGNMVITTTPLQCTGCPLATINANRSCMVLPLVHRGQTFGWLSVAVPRNAPTDKAEQQLFTELGNDVAFALWSMETAARRKTLEQKYADVLDSTSDAVIAVDREGYITLFNRGAESLLGYTADEAIGLPVSRLCPEDLRVEQNAILQALYEEGGSKRVETERITADGRRVFVDLTISLQYDDQGRATGTNAIIRDITERKMAEQETMRLMHAIEQTAETVIITDPDGTILYANPSYETISGYSHDEAIGSRLAINSDTLDDAFYEDMWMTLAKGEPWTGQFINQKKDGTPYTEEAVISPVVNPAGETVNYVVVKRDVTEKINMEDHLNRARRVEAIGRLAGGVAHDLNNLLSPILGYGEMLSDDMDRDDPHREPVAEILRAALRARDLVRQLLAFSRRQTLEFSPLNINDTIETFENLLRRTIREDIKTDIILSSDIGTVMADIGQIEQVIMNLAVNAADAMPDGGRLTIETASAVLDDDYARVHSDVTPGPYVMLAISDTGHGMDEATQALIFEPFFSTKGEYGTGLGLATVYGIVKQHEGHIWVYSEPGHGTIFKIYLPMTETPNIDTDTPQPSISTMKGYETILLVEDDKQVRELTGTLLRRQGYSVLSAGNGRDALSILAAHNGSIHMLLTDVVMPDMNGKELFTRATADHPGLKVLYMSGYTDDVIAKRGVLEAGTPFIQKPFSGKSLAMKIREVLTG